MGVGGRETQCDPEYDEEDGETDEAWNRMKEALRTHVTTMGICPQSPFLCAGFFSHLTQS